MICEAEELFELALNYSRAPQQYQHQVKLLQPSAQGFSRFLELANKSATSDAITSIAGTLRATSDELFHAAFFLIRQVLLSGKDDHYRVLGLEQDASLEEIKKRYRLLIGLFHPDRNPDGAEWTRLYAPRLNEAYNILKKTTRRHAYDEQLRSANVTVASRPVPVSRKRRGSSRTHAKTTPVDWLYRFTLWQKHPKQMVWGSTIFSLSIILILLYYTSSSPDLQLSTEPLPRSGDRLPVDQRTDPARLNDTREALQFALSRIGTKAKESREPDQPNRIPSIVEPETTTATVLEIAEGSADGSASTSSESRLRQAPKQIISDNRKSEQEESTGLKIISVAPDPVAVDVSQTDKVKDARPVKITETVLEDSSNAMGAVDNTKQTTASIKTEDTENENAVALNPPEAEGSTGLETLSPVPDSGVVAVDVSQTDQAKDTGPVKITETVLVHREIKEPLLSAVNTGRSPVYAGNFNGARMDSFLNRYVSAYVSGDLKQMTSLFADRVRTDDGEGVSIIEKDYGNLFRSTAERRIQAGNVQWNKMNEREATMQFHVDLQIRRGRWRDWESYTGTMKFHIVDMDSGLLISEIRHSIREKEM